MRLQAEYWDLLSKRKKKQAAARLPCNLFAIDLFNASEVPTSFRPSLSLFPRRYIDIYVLHNYSTRSRITYLSKVTT